MVQVRNGVFKEQRNPDYFDVVKLVDFGTADYWENDFLSEPFGSASSMAPEMIARKYDLGVDVWGCGVVLFCMLMIRLPFDGKNDEEVIKNIKNKKIRWTDAEFEKQSAPALDLMQRMLQREPEYRITSEEAMSHAFTK